MQSGILAMLEPKHISCKRHAATWQEAVAITGGELEASGYCEARYSDAMRQLIERDGPYLVIAPGVALLHARPEEGALKPGLVLITLETPVDFGHSTNDPVWLLIGLAAVDNKAHVEALAELAFLLSEPGVLEAIQAARRPGDIYAIVQSFAKRFAQQKNESSVSVQKGDSL